MSQAEKTILLTAGILLVLAIKAQAKAKAMFNNFPENSRFHLNNIAAGLSNAGVKDPQLNFALAQMLYETGNFTNKSHVAAVDNNYSGIMFINNPAKQKNATRGTAFPASEGKYYYAHFATVKDWANDFVRILSLNNKPINAIDLKDYVSRLSKNKYFVPNTGQAFVNYYNGLKKYMALLS